MQQVGLHIRQSFPQQNDPVFFNVNGWLSGANVGDDTVQVVEHRKVKARFQHEYLVFQVTTALGLPIAGLKTLNSQDPMAHGLLFQSGQIPLRCHGPPRSVP